MITNAAFVWCHGDSARILFFTYVSNCSFCSSDAGANTDYATPKYWSLEISFCAVCFFFGNATRRILSVITFRSCIDTHCLTGIRSLNSQVEVALHPFGNKPCPCQISFILSFQICRADLHVNPCLKLVFIRKQAV